LAISHSLFLIAAYGLFAFLLLGIPLLQKYDPSREHAFLFPNDELTKSTCRRSSLPALKEEDVKEMFFPPIFFAFELTLFDQEMRRGFAPFL